MPEPQTPHRLDEREAVVRRIAAAALTLAERQAFPPSARRAPPPAVLAQLQASGALCALARRLHAPQLAGQGQDAVFFDIDPELLDPLPAWAAELGELLDAWAGSRAGPAACPDPEGVFAGLFAPLLEFARRDLRIDGEEARVIVHGASAWLQQRLLQLSGRVLATALRQFRRETPPPGAACQAFEDALRAGAIVPLLLRYPVLARVWVRELGNWRRSVDALLADFRADRQALCRRFPGAERPLASFTMGLSDPHENGRTVCRVVFQEGLALAYKPRSVAVEAAHARLLAWFADPFGGAAPAGLDVLDRGDHGWVRWVAHRPCKDEGEVARYYRRFGRLLALNQLLGIGDIHPENLVACGEFPLPVDVEVALRTPLTAQLATPHDGCSSALLDSVLFTNMVPVWVEEAGGVVKDTSGWQPPAGLLRQPRQAWRRVGDDVTLELSHEPVAPLHLPVLDGQAVMPAERLDDLLAGLTSVYDALAGGALDRDAVASAIGEQMARLPLRFVFRDTAVYVGLLERLTAPSCQLSGLARSVEIAALAQATRPAGPAALGALVAGECEAVEANEVPYFRCESDGTGLQIRGLRLPAVFARSGLAHAQARVRGLDAACARRQLDWLLAAFAGRFDRGGGLPAAPIVQRQRRAAADGAHAGAVLEGESARIEALLAETALRGRDGSAGWVGVQPVGTTDRLQLHVLDATLYEGLAGIALFLALRLAVSGADATRALLRATLGGIRAQLDATPAGPGYGTGLGGLAPVLAYAQAVAGEPLAGVLLQRLAAQAPVLPEAVTVAGYDLLDGLAGLVAGFAQAWRWSRAPVLLETAARVGDHLAGRLGEIAAVLDAAHGASVAHGTSGLRLALARLGQALAASGDAQGAARFGQLAQRLAPPLPEAEPRRGAGSWCHGETGWLVAGGPDAGRAARVAAFGGQPPMHLCCGVLGRLDGLLGSGQEAAAPAVPLLLADLVQRAARGGGYPFYLQAPEALLPGLFNGLTGVGYLCERLRHARLGRPAPSVTGIH